MRDDAMEVILTALRSADPAQVTIERDDTTGQLAAKVRLREDQLAEALREDARYVREASVATGLRIDVEVEKSEASKSKDDRFPSKSWWQFWR